MWGKGIARIEINKDCQLIIYCREQPFLPHPWDRLPHPNPHPLKKNKHCPQIPSRMEHTPNRKEGHTNCEI